MTDIKPLLDFIAAAESESSVDRQAAISAYDVVWNGIPVAYRPHAMFGKGLSAMTVAEVLAWQDDIVTRGVKSSASGRYQIIRKTLRDLVADNIVQLDQRFNAKAQDDCAVALLRRCGLNNWQSGIIDDKTFANLLAKEWASFPVIGGPKHGKSYYGGDGLNKSNITPDKMLAMLASVRGTFVSTSSGKEVDPPKSQSAEPAAEPHTLTPWIRLTLRGFSAVLVALGVAAEEATILTKDPEVIAIVTLFVSEGWYLFERFRDRA